MKPKKIPQRMCIACHEMKDKKEMARIVKSNEGEISLDFTGKKNGRGAYICRNSACIERCIKQRLINKSFKCEVPSAVYERIKEEFDSSAKG